MSACLYRANQAPTVTRTSLSTGAAAEANLEDASRVIARWLRLDPDAVEVRLLDGEEFRTPYAHFRLSGEPCPTRRYRAALEVVSRLEEELAGAREKLDRARAALPEAERMALASRLPARVPAPRVRFSLHPDPLETADWQC